MTTKETQGNTNSETAAATRRPPLSVWAMLALALAMLSTVSLVGPVYWGVPGVAILVSAAVLRRIRNTQSPVSGRGVALCALGVSIAFAVAGPSHDALRRWRLSQQARAIGLEWLGFIRAGEAYKALETKKPAQRRLTLDDSLRKFYQEDNSRRHEYRQFLDNELIKTLTALSGNAIIRHYQTEKIERHSGWDLSIDVYAVTFRDGTKRKSFFVMLEMERRENPTSVSGLWRVRRYQGGYRPKTPPE